jgi:glycerophosphoryl diester phosphodiesterase
MFDRSPLLFAHRGAPAELPENTLASFHRGLELGADILELDVHMTRDGTVVVSHDPDGQRLAGVPAAIRTSTLAEVERWDLGGGARVPTLEAVLAAFPTTPLNIDIKQREPDMVPAIVDLLRRAHATDRVLLTSFSTRTVRRLRRIGYEGPRGASRGEVAALLALPVYFLRRRFRRGDAAQLPTSLAFPWFIKKLHAVGLRVDFWTVNDPGLARRLLALGADGIMTDDSRAVAPVFSQLRNKPDISDR